MHDVHLADRLLETWEQQARDGFLLTDPQTVDIPTREALDESCGVRFRFRWLPHREIRGDVAELERRGILNPRRDEKKLFRDPRDPHGRHCFLCRANIADCHPMERLVPITLAGRAYLAGANFAWIESAHFTVMSAEHVDQACSSHLLEAMCDLHRQTQGRFRVLFNGDGAGASIPWHLHLQITTTEMPIERMTDGGERAYPSAVHKYLLEGDGLARAQAAAEAWLTRDSDHHSLNLLVATTGPQTAMFLFPRDKRRATARGKGLMGGFEMAGDFVLSGPAERALFDESSVALARRLLEDVRPIASS